MNPPNNWFGIWWRTQPDAPGWWLATGGWQGFEPVLFTSRSQAEAYADLLNADTTHIYEVKEW